MGMYDNLHINTSKLPISDEEKKIIGNELVWQTKDLDCILTDVNITEEGNLVMRRFNYGWDDTKKNALGTMGVLVEKNVRTEIVNYHGYINFYRETKNGWYEFVAKFTDGKLESIEGGKET